MALTHTYNISTLLLLLLLSLTCFAQDFIQINSPTNGQTVTSKTRLDVSYTVIGAQTLSPAPVNATYPSSMTATFQWSQKGNNDGNSLSFSALGGLNTRHYAAGIQNKGYTASFNVPNCHFFSRYNPSNYDFHLVFTPLYSEESEQQQEPISVALNVQVNNATFPKC
ncbi:unnamed protein product [Absidia cylindrospora]